MANIAIRVTITLRSPLLITAQQIGFVRESESFIPGSVLRGSVAQILLANCILDEKERHAPESVPGHQGKCDFHRISHRVLAMHIPVLNHQLVFCHGLHAHARSMVVLDAMKLIASDMVLLIL